MISKTTIEFWKSFQLLPKDIQDLAREKFNRWLDDPFHPALHFKELHTGLWSVRVNVQYRALGFRDMISSSGSGSDHTRSMIG